MNYLIKNVIIGIFVLSLFFTSCSNFSKPLPSVSVVVGFVELIRKGNTKALSEGQSLNISDTLKTQKYSKTKLHIRDGELYLNSMSCLCIEKNPSHSDFPGFSLNDGELFLNYKSDSTHLTLNTPSGSITVLSSEVFIKYDQKTETLMITPLFGNVKFKNFQNDDFLIPQCHSVLIYNNKVKDPVSVTEKQVANLKSWVGKTAITEAMILGNCEAQKIEKTVPPEWIKLPKEEISAGDFLEDTVTAVGNGSDKTITYQLVNGPDGYSIDSLLGIIRFKSSKPCSLNIIIRATDSESRSSDLEYTLKVYSTPQAIINVPSVVFRNQKFDILASVAGTNIDAQKYLYRFDLDDDGRFDFPQSQEFGKSRRINSFSFSEGGYHKISVEIKNPDNDNIFSRSRKIFVNTPPEAKLQIIPETGTVETEFVLDVTGSSDLHDSLHMIIMQVDTYIDGEWKLLQKESMSADKKLTFSWENPGSYPVRLIVTDSFGMSDTVTKEVVVNHTFSIKSISAPDSANLGDTVHFTCNTDDVSGVPVKEYEWSFKDDSVFAKTTHNSVKHVFNKAGKHIVVCSAVDENGLKSQNQIEIIITKGEIHLDANGPYKVRINKVLTVEGKVDDPNNRIGSYKWDFDGDDKADYSSDSSTKTTYVFSRSGEHVIWLVAETDNGETVSDSAVVKVTNSKPTANAGEDFLSRAGKNVKLNGLGEDKDSNIVRYEWDFDSDGKADWSSEENGITKHAFEKYSIAVFTVTDSDSAKSSDSIRIIICPDDMATIKNGKFCIDKYEWPNKKGEQPRVNVTYEEARKACLDKGKRLCTPAEWEMACKSEKEKNNYPYGAKYKAENCNTMGNPIVKNSLSTSGHFIQCVGSVNVYDMSGNVAEWTETASGNPYVYGGSWQNGKDGSRCNSRIELETGRKYFYAGFRCCK